MINLSLDSGVFPDEWNVADVRPSLKKSNLDTCTAFENLRPVSNLSYVAKLTERTVFNQSNKRFSEYTKIVSSGSVGIS